MKICVSFLFLSTLFLLSQQQDFYALRQFQNAYKPWSIFPFRHLSIQDFYDYLHARDLAESFKPVKKPQHLKVQESAPQWADVQSRTKSASTDEADASSNDDENEQHSNARFFLNYVTTAGGSNSYYNPLLKTIYYITTTTATTTLVSTCVPAVSFDQTSYTVKCRRRRDVLEMLLDGEESPEIVSEIMNDPDMLPSKVVPVEPSPVARFPRDLGDDAVIVPIEVASSKTEDYLMEKGYITAADKLREKRFFIASSTITSVAFISTVSTKTLSNIKGTLSCLPSQFLLC